MSKLETKNHLLSMLVQMTTKSCEEYRKLANGLLARADQIEKDMREQVMRMLEHDDGEDPRKS